MSWFKVNRYILLCLLMKIPLLYIIWFPPFFLHSQTLYGAAESIMVTLPPLPIHVSAHTSAAIGKNIGWFNIVCNILWSSVLVKVVLLPTNLWLLLGLGPHGQKLSTNIYLSGYVFPFWVLIILLSNKVLSLFLVCWCCFPFWSVSHPTDRFPPGSTVYIISTMMHPATLR